MLTVPGEITLSNNSNCAVWSIICAVRLYTLCILSQPPGTELAQERLLSRPKLLGLQLGTLRSRW